MRYYSSTIDNDYDKTNRQVAKLYCNNHSRYADVIFFSVGTCHLHSITSVGVTWNNTVFNERYNTVIHVE